jgi:hypothetical protein
MEPASRAAGGNRYDEAMVVHDVSVSLKAPGMLLVGRPHVDLCRLASSLPRLSRSAG